MTKSRVMKRRQRRVAPPHQSKLSRRRGSNKRLWIEACPESTISHTIPASSCYVVTISRVELYDELLQGASTKSLTDGTEATATAKDDEPRACTTDSSTSPSRDLDTESTKRRRTEKTIASSDEATPSNNREVSAPSLIRVQRAPSALKPRSYLPHNPDFKLLPNGDCGDGVANPHADVEDKYWAQRRRLFSRFDQGIELDPESWYSVTPEVIAQHIAHRMVQGTSSNNEMVILDAFGGAGGNTVALCQRPEVKLVVCVDTDPSRLRMAANNCRIYDIPSSKVVFVRANAVTVLESYSNGHLLPSPQYKPQGDETENVHGYSFGSISLLPKDIHAIFLSPPWGGPELVESAGCQDYDLEHIKLECGDEVITGEVLLNLAQQALPLRKNFAFFLPRNTNGKKIAMSAIESGFRGGMELEGNVLNCKLKTVTAYFQ